MGELSPCTSQAPPSVQAGDGGGFAEKGGNQEGGGGLSPDTPETTPLTELPRSGRPEDWRITLLFVGTVQGLPRTPKIEGNRPGEGPDQKLQWLD